MKDFRIVFMGTPDFAVASLDAIIKAGLNIVGVVTAPDKPAGRGRKLNESAVKSYAKTLDIPILQPEKLKAPEFLNELEALKPDLNVVVAFRMLPEAVWDMPTRGTINLHGSLLPQYRGAAPINWAIINGEKKTGVTTFFIDKEIDTGDIIDKAEIEIAEGDNVGTMHDKLMVLGAELLTNTVKEIAEGKERRTQQNAVIDTETGIKHAPKIFKDDCIISWEKQTDVVFNFIRGLSPYPAAWTKWNKKDGETLSLKIFAATKTQNENSTKPGTIDSDGKSFLNVATQNGWLSIKELQLQGKKRMKTADFLRGVKLDQYEEQFLL